MASSGSWTKPMVALAITLPIAIAITLVGWKWADSVASSARVTPKPLARTEPGPTTTVTVKATVTIRPTVKAGRAVSTPKAKPTISRVPQGKVEITNFQNAIEYSPSCAHVILYVANRSDTAVRTLTVRFSGDDARDHEIDLGTRTINAGLPPFEEKTYHVRVCDKRMAGGEFGPSAIPGKFRWTWFS